MDVPGGEDTAGYAARSPCAALSRFCGLILAIACLSAVFPLQAQESKRILLLFSNESLLPAGQILTHSIQSAMNAGTEEHLEFFPEYLDFVRFSEPRHEARMVDFLRGKYESTRFDLIFAIGPEALRFTVKHRAELSLLAPVVFTGIREGSLSLTEVPADIVGTTFELDPVKTLDLALQLQPDTQHVVVVTGAAPFDKRWEATARASYRDHEKRLDFIYLSGLPMPDLLQKVANLPMRSVVVYFTVLTDGAGTRFYGRDVAKLISSASNAPVYGLYDTFLGFGIVGGYMSRFEDVGNSAAGIALRILAGENPASASLRVAQTDGFMVDFRQLDRWNLNANRLPPGTAVLFKEPPFWERYRNEFIVICAVIAVQTLLIAALLMQRRRRRRAEEHLRQSEERISIAAESANLGFWQLDPVTYRIWATEHCRRILGLAPDAEVTQQSFINACHPEDRAHATRICRDPIENGKSYEQEYRVVHPDGQVRWILDRAHNLVDAAGKSRRITGVVIDITERKKASEALRESEERYRNVVETQSELICRYLPDGTLTFVNDAYCRFFGRSRDELIGKNFTELLPEDARQGALSYVQTLMNNQHPVRYEHQVIGRMGRRAWQEWNDRVIRGTDGKITELQGVGRDITELKRAKREARDRSREVTHLTRVASLGELSGALAHELNQPLTAILSNAQAAQRILAKKVIDLPEVREILNDIVIDDNRASEVIRRLRVLFKKGEAQLQPTDVNEVTMEVLGLAHSELITHQVTGSYHLTPDLPPVQADRVQLQQVLLNLVVNACEAMGATDPKSRKLGVSTILRDNGIVNIEVTDHGSGVPQDTMDRLFEPFYTTKENGLGLGLSISRSIVASHGGRLSARNNPDQGATFVVELPRAVGGSQ
jgi:PAS domain S-box-containing protein